MTHAQYVEPTTVNQYRQRNRAISPDSGMPLFLLGDFVGSIRAI